MEAGATGSEAAGSKLCRLPCQRRSRALLLLLLPPLLLLLPPPLAEPLPPACPFPSSLNRCQGGDFTKADGTGGESIYGALCTERCWLLEQHSCLHFGAAGARPPQSC